MEWHLVTGEYPPDLGGVADYTYVLAEALADRGESVHIWTAASSEAPRLPGVEIHGLPHNFGLAWLRALDRGLPKISKRRKIVIQYVPHMYGWKSMNLAFCVWLALRRKQNFWIMFHEVAFPFRKRQRWKHHLLAIIHRVMAWMILHTAARSFTSIDAYKETLSRIAPKVRVELLRLFSNVPFSRAQSVGHLERLKTLGERPTIGVFSSFGDDICKLLEQTLATLLTESNWGVLLIGPGQHFIERFCRNFPHLKRRLHTTGRLKAMDAAPAFRMCDVLLQLYPDGACCARGTLIAALASGVPVISNVGPLTGAILKRSRALALTNLEPHTIRATMEALLADKTAALKLGAEGRRLYDRNFDASLTLTVLSDGHLEPLCEAACDLEEPANASPSGYPAIGVAGIPATVLPRTPNIVMPTMAAAQRSGTGTAASTEARYTNAVIRFLAVLITLALGTAAADDPFIGKWKLDLSKSKLTSQAIEIQETTAQTPLSAPTS